MAGKLDGSKAIQSGTITTTQLATALSDTISAGGGPKIKSLIYPGDDTAANTIGGQTVYITGSGFDSNVAVYINGAAVPSVSYISASNVGFTTPALSAATYPVYVTNPDDGATAILIPGMLVSGEPSWVTGATLAEQDASSAWNISLSATGDAPLTYALAAGSSLPSGISLASNGVISGTLSSPPETDTTYNFTVVATDAQNQDSSRAFSVTASAGEGVLFANNVLLIHADGTNNGNNHHFLDSSNNNFTITRNGNATQGSFSPFSQTGWSNLFDGVDDNLSVSAGSGSWADFGSGEFTIEAWIFPRTVSTLQGICGTHTGGTNTWQFRLNNATLEIFGGASGGTAYAGGSVAANTWTHVAACRSGTNVYVFVNGILTTRSVGSSDTFPAGTNVTIGNLYSSPSAYWFNGYISNLRILKGTAQYTSNFTPPISALTAVSNTQLLTCQSNRFIDNSTNAFTITRNGDVSIQAWSPFAPTAAYTTANVGGSVYLDGTGDYLTFPTNNLLLSSNNFTAEAWVYLTTSPSTAAGVFYGQGDGSSAAGSSYGFLIAASTTSDIYVGSTGYSITSPTPKVGEWAHVAWARTGGVLSSYLNGARVGTRSDLGSSAINNGSTTKAPTIGAVNAGGAYLLTGYISNARLIVGNGGYDATQTTITVPSAPLTNVANTQLLLNFTNAQIFDQTAKNVLECIGDAKVSTAQYKYGSASIAFDGTGDYLKMPSSPIHYFGTGSWTIEFWVKSSMTTRCDIIGYDYSYTIGTWAGLIFNVSGNNQMSWYEGSNQRIHGTSVSWNNNNWHHVAISRNGNSLKMFLDGTQVGSTYTTSYTYGNASSGWYIGTSTDGNVLNGYIDDLRITKGYARYTANFTAPTAKFKDK